MTEKGAIAFTRQLIAVIVIVLLAACEAESTPEELLELGRIEEAVAAGLKIPAVESKAPPAQGRFEEKLDSGDDPLNPGCACEYRRAGCGLPIKGRTVDECYPDDGVSLVEKTVPTTCGNDGKKDYNCEKLLGKGAICVLKDLTCCNVKTTSGYCFLQLQ